MAKKLTARKLKILQKIIDEFIESAEPVSSKKLAESSDLNYSSATIRNEMAELEEMGFLTHTHTSSGRMPTNSAYRLYVNELIANYELPEHEKERVREKLLMNMANVNDSIRNIADTLAELTNMTTFAITPTNSEKAIKYISITEATKINVILTIVADDDEAFSSVITLTDGYDKKSLVLLSKSMTTFYMGKKITDALRTEIIKTFLSDIKSLESISDQVVPTFIQTLEKMLDKQFYYKGIEKVFELPESSDPDSLKSFFENITNEKKMTKLLQERKDGVDITIGEENNDEVLNGNTLITASYHVNGKLVGKLGVIGPTRMKYDKITSIMKYLTENAEEILKE